MNNASIYSNQAWLSSVLKKTSPQNVRQNGPTCKKGILVVEDDFGVRRFLKTILASEGYNVFEAESEGQARKIWQQHFSQIDLLFTDLCIPYQATGVELAKRLRTEKSWLKVIYTSGFSAEIVAAEDRSLVVNVNFICKPYPARKLLDTVQRCFGEEVALSSN